MAWNGARLGLASSHKTVRTKDSCSTAATNRFVAVRVSIIIRFLRTYHLPIKTDVWTVGMSPTKLRQSRLASEQLLEEMIINSPSILSDEWMLIGSQENTGMGGRIDLLALAPDGALVLIELKRDRTPREVVAQTLDYAA